MSATEQRQVTVPVLTREQYKRLEDKALSGVHITDSTSGVQAGYFLGIQHVLKLLRDGYTYS